MTEFSFQSLRLINIYSNAIKLSNFNCNFLSLFIFHEPHQWRDVKKLYFFFHFFHLYHIIYNIIQQERKSWQCRQRRVLSSVAAFHFIFCGVLFNWIERKNQDFMFHFNIKVMFLLVKILMKKWVPFNHLHVSHQPLFPRCSLIWSNLYCIFSSESSTFWNHVISIRELIII